MKKTNKQHKFTPDSNGNIFVGTYRLGPKNVDLYATVPPHESGGSFYFAPEERRLPRIKVCIDELEWKHTVAILHHEAMELSMQDHHCRFLQSGQFSASHASYLFVMDHEQFTECSEWTGQFMSNCLPELAKAFDHFKRSAKEASAKITRKIKRRKAQSQKK